MNLEEIKIELAALLEQLDKYKWISSVYISEARNAISIFDARKIHFCLTKIVDEFETDDWDWINNEIYKKLKKTIANLNQYFKDLDDKKREIVPLIQFWTALHTWLDIKQEDPADLYQSKYQDTYYDQGRWWTQANVDLEKLYKMTYGKIYVNINDDYVSFEVLKEFLEAYYREVVEIQKGRLKLTVKVNELFNRFQLPYKLEKGKLIKPGYKTSYRIDEILNYEQFERKIQYANEMIIHNDFIDKHSALNYMADSFCYLKSLTKDSQTFAKTVDEDNNTQVYSIIKAEIDYISKIINDVFDIRHNEKYAIKKDNQVRTRESLTDLIFVEYLYNCINALLSLLRIKHNQGQKKISETVDSVATESKLDENLPF